MTVGEFTRRQWHNPELDRVRGEGEHEYVPGGPLVEPSAEHPANLISSLCEDGLHRPALDIDVPMVVRPSRTEGHHHVEFPSIALEWWQYQALMMALANAGIVEPAYVRYSLERGQSLLRIPADTPAPAESPAPVESPPQFHFRDNGRPGEDSNPSAVVGLIGRVEVTVTAHPVPWGETQEPSTSSFRTPEQMLVYLDRRAAVYEIAVSGLDATGGQGERLDGGLLTRQREVPVGGAMVMTGSEGGLVYSGSTMWIHPPREEGRPTALVRGGGVEWVHGPV